MVQSPKSTFFFVVEKVANAEPKKTDVLIGFAQVRKMLSFKISENLPIYQKIFDHH